MGKIQNIRALILVFMMPFCAWAQNAKISGKVTAQGVPLVGVSVIVKGTTVGTATDIDGKYSLEVPNSQSKIQYSFLGYKTEERAANAKVINVSLIDNSNAIGEVVVLGYGASTRKQDLSASVGVLSNVDQLATRPVASTEAMLQGQLAGVTVSSNGGDPTSAPSVVIRGQGSLKDNVLWVVDGIPGAPIASMNDIESFVVLKDAASAAIYGAQSGAAGVILVTTKKAKIGAPSLSYDGVFGIRQATKLPQSLTAEEQIKMRTLSYGNAGLTPPTGWNTTVNPWIGTTRTDWMDAIFRSAFYQRHNLAFSTGNEGFNSRFSFSYDDNQGVLVNTFSKSTNFRYNANFKLNKWVSVNEDFIWKNTSGRGANTSSAYGGVILSAIYMPRSATVYNPLDGSYGGVTTEDPAYIAKYGSNFSDIHGDVINPVRMLSADNNYSKTSDTWSTTTLEIANILQGLKFTSRFTYNLATNYYKNFSPIRDEVGKPNMSNSLDESSYRRDAWKAENSLTYDHTFGKHSISGLVSTTADHEEQRGLALSGSGFADESKVFQYFGYASSTTGSDYLSGPDANVSLISRLAYSFDDRYFVTASWRRDYAGRLPQKYNHGDFPAVTAGWKISNEKFFKKSDALSFLKLRASWGRIGNLSSIVPNYKSHSLYKGFSSSSGQYGVTEGVKWGNEIYNGEGFNPQLTWETSEQADFGLDAEMLRKRLSLSVDYFEKRTFSLIQGKTTDWPSTMGLNPMMVNQGEVRNRGLEIQANWQDKINKDFSYFVSGNFAWLKNWVSSTGVKNTDGTPGVWVGDGSFRNIPYMYQTAQGQPLNSYYLVKTDGIFQSDAEAAAYVGKDGKRIQPNAVAGDLKFVDYDGDGTINIAKDRQYMGNATPKTTFAFTLGFTYKKLSASAMFQGVGGAQALYVGKYMLLSDVEGNFNRSNEILNAWSPTNTSSNIPRLSKSDSNGNFVTPSSWYLEDASYLRIKNLTISYDLTDLLRKSSHLAARNSSMSMYLSGENLHTFTKYSGMDPETVGWDGLTYPVSRVFSVGVKLTY